jgi:multimeric flavodoxin WrbA
MKKICILNGSRSDNGQALDKYLERLEGILESRKYEVTRLVLRDMDIRYCHGCWDCWVKTPGECVIKDDSSRVLQAIIDSDFVLTASPVVMGFTSSVLKRAKDRFIPLIHPYFAIVQGEFHHRQRYEKYPLLGLILEMTPGSDEEDIEIISDIYARNALNLQTVLKFVRLTSDPEEEVADEIGRI